MRQKILTPAVLILLAVCFPVLSSGGKYPQKLALEEVLSIGDLDDDTLFQWVGVTADSVGHIYVTDAMDYSLKKFDADGNLLDKTGRRGQGPGEFTAPRLLDCSEDFLFVTEQYQPVIKVFDKKLQYKFQIPLDGPAGDMKVLGNDLVAVVALSAKSVSNLCFYDREGNIVKKMIFSEDHSRLLMDMVSFDLDGKGNLLLRTKKDGERYTSGAMRTKGKFEHKFGYWVCRCKFPTKEGHWPAFWLHIGSVGKVGNGGRDGTEIDIMENFTRDGIISHNIHWNGYGKNRGHKGSDKKQLEPTEDGWHTFGLHWSQSGYVFYVDGKISWEVDGPVSHREQFILVSTECKGYRKGEPDPELLQAVIPDYFIVDYVRVYDEIE